MPESPLAPPAPPSRKGLYAALAAIAAAILVVAVFVRWEVNGPRAPGAQAPKVAISVALDTGGPPLAEGAKLPQTGHLIARVTLPRAARVSLVHLDVGHGMEALLLNAPLGPGEHLLAVDGGAATLDLRDLSGPQVLAAVASERDLVQDEALSAARGLTVEHTTVAAFRFSVGP